MIISWKRYSWLIYIKLNLNRDAGLPLVDLYSFTYIDNQ